MENVHNAIAWYQTKIGSYDKQLWEQSVERKLQKQPPFVLHNAPRKKVRLKTEYIDVDLIRGSTFTKTKPQVPWVYITRKAVARVIFFPFYYNWWVHQTSKRLYALLLVLYVLQVITVIVYLRNFDHGIMADELCFTEVTLPTILMFLLCLIHSQTVLAHINHKPPKRNKNISGVTRKPRPKKASRRGRSSGNNSTCPEDGGNTDTSRPSRRRAQNQPPTDVDFESYPLNTTSDPTKIMEPLVSPSIDIEKNVISHSMNDFELTQAISSSQNEFLHSVCSSLHNQYGMKNDAQLRSSWHQDTDSSFIKQNDENDGNVHNKLEDQEENSSKVQNSVCNNTLQDNLSNHLTAKKVCYNTLLHSDNESNHITNRLRDKYCKCSSAVKLRQANLLSTDDLRHSMADADQHCFKVMTENSRKTLTEGLSHDCVDIDRSYDNEHVSSNTKCEEISNLAAPESGIEREKCECSYGVSAKTCIHHITETNENVVLGLDMYNIKPAIECSSMTINIQDASLIKSAQNQHHGVNEVCYQCPPSSDNLGLSDFELIDHHVAHDENASDQETSPHELATCSFIQTWTNDFDLNSTAEQTENAETHHVSVRFKSKPFKSQDSSDSGINNEVPCVDCICLSMHKDSLCDCAARNKWHTTSTSGVDETDDVSSTYSATGHQPHCGHQTKFKKQSISDDASSLFDFKVSHDSSNSLNDSYEPPTVKVQCLPLSSMLASSQHNETDDAINHHLGCVETSESKTQSHILFNPSILQNENPKIARKMDSQTSISHNLTPQISESSLRLHCFSEQFVQEILNEDTLREMSCSSLLVHSDLEHSSSSAVSRLSTASTTSSASNLSSSCCKICNTHHIPHFAHSSSAKTQEPSERHYHIHHNHHNLRKQQPENILSRLGSHERFKMDDSVVDEKNDLLDESLEHIHASDGERPSDDVSNYNPSDSDGDSDGPVNVDICNKYEEKWKRLRFQDHAAGSDNTGKIITSKAHINIASGLTTTKAGSGSTINSGSRSVVGILTRKPSPLKDLAIVRKPNSSIAVINSSGSDQELNEVRNQLRRRRRTSGTPSEPTEPNRIRNVPTALSLHPSETKSTHLSSSENETGGARTPEGSNKATMSSEEWEDRMQSDETTSSAYSSNSEVDSEDREEGEEKTEYTTSTLHVINLLQPLALAELDNNQAPPLAMSLEGVQPSCVPQTVQQSGSPSSSGNITQPDRVSCVIWEGNECKKVDLTALDIGWAIIDKVDSLPESSDYFLIGLSFSFVICVVPLVFRAYASKDAASLEDFLSWSGLMTKLIELSVIIRNSYSWRQYLLMINGILQRFLLSLIFFFLLSVADRTFKQRLLYAKHFSYLTSSRRARKFSMPHFRLNKVRNIKIWLSLRSYLKRRGPQRSVDVIVSACFLCAVCTVCLISLQMLKDTDSYLDYLCNWELLVWCTALSVFLMRFMTVGLKINKKYRNLSVLITEQINLYLQMEQKPHKKEELILANNVLRLAEDLLKELESPFKISGFSANPLIYNIMRVVVLSAFSAVLTEVLGFKLKLHKIKLKG